MFKLIGILFVIYVVIKLLPMFAFLLGVVMLMIAGIVLF